MKLNITQKGKELMMRCIDMAGNGEVLTLTHLVLGNGTHTDDIGEQLMNPLLHLAINSFERNESSVELTSVFDNSAVSDRFRITEMGVLAKDPEDEEATILFAYGYVPENEASVVPAVTDLIFETSITVSVFIGSLDNIEVALEGKLQGVSKETFESHIKDYNNPHKVTAKIIGLENVENVAFTEHTPVYTIPEKISETTPGEKFSLFLGKVGRGLADLIKHIKDKNNPHKTNCEQVGAANKDHKHSANDITSGILGLERGGTSVASLPELKRLLGFGNMEILTGTYTGNGKSGIKYPCKLSFDGRKPLVVFVSGGTASLAPGGDPLMTCTIILGYGSTQEKGGFTPTGEEGLSLSMKWEEDAVEWYAIGEDKTNVTRCASQKTEEGVVYTWTAICLSAKKEA